MLHKQLPQTTIINRVIPKNSFDPYSNTKQKKLFVELVERIVWTNKLSKETINLLGKEISEIQVFEIVLRKDGKLDDVLQLIDRAIPYPIVFILLHAERYKLSTSQKHSHPTNPNNTVIDWTFSSPWIEGESAYSFHLKQNLDYVFTDLCKQIIGRKNDPASLHEIILREQKVSELTKEIAKLKSAIKTSKQFNQKVDLNLVLQAKMSELQNITWQDK